MEHVYVTAFNNATGDFLDDLARAYPNVLVFGLVGALHRSAASHDRTIPIERFHKHVMQKYGPSLRDLDFSFFLDADYEEAPVDTDVVAHIKRLWVTMTPENQACIKEHLRLLVGLYDEVYHKVRAA